MARDKIRKSSRPILAYINFFAPNSSIILRRVNIRDWSGMNTWKRWLWHWSAEPFDVLLQSFTIGRKICHLLIMIVFYYLELFSVTLCIFEYFSVFRKTNQVNHSNVLPDVNDNQLFLHYWVELFIDPLGHRFHVIFIASHELLYDNVAQMNNSMKVFLVMRNSMKRSFVTNSRGSISTFQNYRLFQHSSVISVGRKINRISLPNETKRNNFWMKIWTFRRQFRIPWKQSYCFQPSQKLLSPCLYKLYIREGWFAQDTNCVFKGNQKKTNSLNQDNEEALGIP